MCNITPSHEQSNMSSDILLCAKEEAHRARKFFTQFFSLVQQYSQVENTDIEEVKSFKNQLFAIKSDIDKCINNLNNCAPEQKYYYATKKKAKRTFIFWNTNFHREQKLPQTNEDNTPSIIIPPEKSGTFVCAKNANRKNNIIIHGLETDSQDAILAVKNFLNEALQLSLSVKRAIKLRNKAVLVSLESRKSKSFVFKNCHKLKHWPAKISITDDLSPEKRAERKVVAEKIKDKEKSENNGKVHQNDLPVNKFPKVEVEETVNKLPFGNMQKSLGTSINTPTKPIPHSSSKVHIEKISSVGYKNKECELRTLSNFIPHSSSGDSSSESECSGEEKIDPDSLIHEFVQEEIVQDHVMELTREFDDWEQPRHIITGLLKMMNKHNDDIRFSSSGCICEAEINSDPAAIWLFSRANGIPDNYVVATIEAIHNVYVQCKETWNETYVEYADDDECICRSLTLKLLLMDTDYSLS